MRKVLDGAIANHTDIIRDVPGICSLPTHPFVSVRLNDGRMKHLKDKVVIYAASRIFIDVNAKYDGPPITMYLTDEVLNA